MIITEPRQTARYERKREAILEAAALLFNARGLGGTTLADVAQRVGLTTTSVTYYYRRKEDLAVACVTRAIENLNDLLTEAEFEDGSEARLRHFVMLYFDQHAQVVTGMRPVLINFWDGRALTGPGAEAATLAFTEMFRRFRRWFEDPAGPVLSRPEQNARTLHLLGALLWAKEWLNHFDVEDFPRCAACFTDILIFGFASAEADWTVEAVAPPPPRASVIEVSREAFLRAATELVNEHGYRGASVDRISAKLSVTKGSFYHHNVTKDQLVAQCFERSFEVTRAAYRAAPRDLGKGWIRLCRIATALVRFQFSEHGSLLRYYALAATPELMRPKLVSDFDRLARRTAGVIVDGIVDGSVRRLDPTIAALIFTGMVNASAELRHWCPGLTEEEAVAFFVRPSLLGVFSDTQAL